MSDSTKHIATVLVLSIAIFASCRVQQVASPYELHSGLNTSWIVAWNEDTVHSCQIALQPYRKFSLALVDKQNGVALVSNYSGTLKLAGDSILLTYKEGKRPANFKEFLIIEASRNYLIQEMQNTKQRMFLRIQRHRSGI